MTPTHRPATPVPPADRGATAVSSGETSAYHLAALQPEMAGAHPVLPGAGVDRSAPAPGTAAYAPSAARAVRPAPTSAALEQRWGRTEAGLTAAEIRDIESGAYEALPRRDAQGGVIGSITGWFRRCKAWINEDDKPKRSRIGMRVVIDETPSEGSVISLTRPGRTARTVRDKARERAVRAEAQRLASHAPAGETPAESVQRRILEKRQAMLDMQRQRELEEAEAAAAEAAEAIDVAIVRPTPRT